MLVFENYVPSFSKKCRNYASTFYFQFRKNTSELTIQLKQLNGKRFYPLYNQRLFTSVIIHYDFLGYYCLPKYLQRYDEGRKVNRGNSKKRGRHLSPGSLHFGTQDS